MKKRILEHLKILQLEGYAFARYLRWAMGKQQSKQRSNLVWTLRMRLLVLLLLLELGLGFGSSFTIGLLGVVAMIVSPYVYLFLPNAGSGVLVKFYETWVAYAIRTTLAREKVVTIGITGSYGKTTTKDLLYRILDRWQYTLKTPGSYNTLLGIYKTLQMELTSKHVFFICEMGAFERGDIAKLCRVVRPEYGMVTAIGSQHLERFGSESNVASAKFELVDFVGAENSLVNVGNAGVRNKLAETRKPADTYSADERTEAEFLLKNVRMGKDGIRFGLLHGEKKWNLRTSLFGSVNLENIAGAVAMAIKLGAPESIIREEVAMFEGAEHRAQMTRVDKTMVIDNTYSSNEVGFSMMMQDLKIIKGKKALITPGLVELGEKSNAIHEQLGRQAANVFDTICLVGKTERTQSFESGLRTARFGGDVAYYEAGTNPWDVYGMLEGTYDWVLMENDLPDSYY